MHRDAQSVISALNDQHYKWRTISGIAKSTGLPADTVRRIISEQRSLIIQSSALSPAGETLFTTRDRHNREATTWSKIRSALRNRAD